MSEPTQNPTSKPSDVVLEAWNDQLAIRHIEYTAGYNTVYGPTRLDFDFGRAYERLVLFELYEQNRARELQFEQP